MGSWILQKKLRMKSESDTTDTFYDTVNWNRKWDPALLLFQCLSFAVAGLIEFLEVL